MTNNKSEATGKRVISVEGLTRAASDKMLKAWFGGCEKHDEDPTTEELCARDVMLYGNSIHTFDSLGNKIHVPWLQGLAMLEAANLPKPKPVEISFSFSIAGVTDRSELERIGEMIGMEPERD